MKETERHQEIVLLRGLPGAGKSTYAYKWVDQDPDFRVRVNRDDIRYQLYKKYHGLSRHQEETVSALQHGMSGAALKAGMSVVVDDTNLSSQTVREWYSTADKHKLPLSVVDFNVSVEECIRQDRTRLKFVGEPVIRDFAKRYLKKGHLPELPDKPAVEAVKGSAYVPDESKPGVYIFDIDGTLARMVGRSPFAWHRVGEDHEIPNVIRVAKLLSESYPLILMSGRDEICRPETEEWLSRAGIEFKELHMRPTMPKGVQDEPDDIVKLALFDNNIRNNYNVLGVFDDRLRVCQMWENIGLTLFRVGPLSSAF